jgi:N6-L-threonylcarbamoyladenine synthase
MRILAIETSCDETAVALVKASGGLKSPRFRILKNIVASQIKTHRPWGGVVPNLAKREHEKNLPLLFRNLKLEIRNFRAINLLTVTVGPGLEPCLWSGIEFTKEIHKNYFPKAKLIGVNHLEGHLYSFLLPKQKKTVNSKFEIRNSKIDSKFKIQNSKLFPAIALLVSGGHTILLKMGSLTNWEKLGETRDDAVGEVFDKVARMLGFPFPGGPEIEKLSIYGRPTSIDFPRPMINSKNYDFSFSGLKTSVLYYLRDNHSTTKSLKLKADVAASFQQAAIDVLIHKTIRAAKEYKVKSIMLAGGVAANKLLRKQLSVISYQLSVNFFAPAMKFNTDNAAMIAAAAYINYLRKKNREIRAQANLNL